MNLRWTFGQKIAAGFAVVVTFTLINSFVNIRALRTVVADKDRVLADNAASLIDTAKFQGALEWKVAAVRGFLLAGKERYLQRLAEADNEVARLLRQLKSMAPRTKVRRTYWRASNGLTASM